MERLEGWREEIWREKERGTGNGMSAGSQAWKQGEGMRDEGEQGEDGWAERERGGDAGVFPGTAFSCTHTYTHTHTHSNNTHPGGALSQAHIHEENISSQAQTKTHTRYC